MLTVRVCVGSSCHLKGSYGVLDAFKEYVKKYGVEDKIDLRPSFCLNRCSQGINVKAGDTYISGVSPESAEKVFVEQVLPLVR